MEHIKKLVGESRLPEALRALLQHASATDDYNKYMSLCRLRRKIGDDVESASQSKDLRIAILGGATTEFLEMPLKLELETRGISGNFFSADYNTFVPEMLDAKSRTAAFRPDVAVVLVTPFNVSDWPGVGDTQQDVRSLVDRQSDHWLGLCQALHANANCEIVLQNLHLLPTRSTGNLGSRLPWDSNNFLRQVNVALSEKAPPYVHILDVDTLSSMYGVANWFDPRFWHHSKQPVSFQCVVPYVRNMSAIIAALYGMTAKCLVLDLDNTLWGGVVGDDGVEGLKIGEGDAESEAFKSFQEYLLALKNRGLLLAVCSKNEEANALAPFEQLPEMVLKKDDFVSFKANWDPKPRNIEDIARELNIGLDALVFVDDNPAERELVRQSLPQVKVVELSSDPAEYPLILDRSGWLEIVKLTDEDKKKTDQYLENRQRSELQVQHTDYDGYLKSLDQRAVIREFEPQHLDRISQLVNKTNQFNLTTQRLSRSEVETLMGRPDTVSAYVRLADRFGDNGLISVLSGHREGSELHLDLWLMSCRVFQRGLEHLLANYILEKAKNLGIQSVHGVYKPTAKNKIVKDFYADLGFTCSGTEEDGTSFWAIESNDYKPVPVHIDLVEDYGK